MQLSVARCSSFADWSEDWVGLYASINESESSKGDWKRTDCEIAQSNRTRKQERAEACGPPTTTAREIVIQEDTKWSEIEREIVSHWKRERERERERLCPIERERESEWECEASISIWWIMSVGYKQLSPTKLQSASLCAPQACLYPSLSPSHLLLNNLSLSLIYLQTIYLSISFTYKHSLSHLLTNIFYLIYSQIYYLSQLLTNILSLSLIYFQTFCL